MRARKPTIFLGTDHAGLKLKDAIKSYLVGLGYHVHDAGAFEHDPADDYPDFIVPAVEGAVRSRGMAIVFGGSGVGECIAANKVKGARAALVHDAYGARMSRLDNDANVLCMGGRTATKDLALAKRLVRTWLATPFSKAKRHARRIKKLASYEKR